MPAYGTTFEFTRGDRAPRGDVLIVPLAPKPAPPLALVSAVDRLCDDAVSELIEVGALSEEAGRIAHAARRGPIKRIILVSLGANGSKAEANLRKAAAATAAWLGAESIRSAVLWLDGLLGAGVEDAAATFAGELTTAAFRFTEHKKPDKPVVERLRVALAASQADHVRQQLPAMQAAAQVGDAVNYARALAHQPPNVIHPASLAREAQSLARKHKLKCTVLAGPALERIKARGLLAVGNSAKHKPCLIRLEYRGAPRSRQHLVAIGKAITFDTGGYSIKTADSMVGMKFDKCGGMAVLGVLKAVATLKVACNVTGLIAAAENAISEEAYRPNDIIHMMNGRTVEIISTDAEGRMVLADALVYAEKECKPTAMVDLATLTGGVVVALGKYAAGLMSTDDALASELNESGRRTGEKLWRLPLWDEYRELIKGTDSDIKNSSGSRFAHPIVGGMFLKEFVSGKVPWAHLDIAGTATTEDSKNATGFGVRLLVDYLRRTAGQG